ncbi:helix-turn-helix domain-containing protein [Tardiphaga sp. 862_B3_N1_1]|uniref:helix-turn-helix domain-containing protein n=1 Tax=Tardiphaga sp. 862_B3_N1_1 TaxID=3240763 RepID=UPI003F8BB523
MSKEDDEFEARFRAENEKTIAAAKRLGAVVREHREKAGLTQADLATLVKSSQQTIDRIERGETKHSRAFPKILAALKIENEASFSELALSEVRLQETIETARQSTGRDPFQSWLPHSDPDRMSVFSIHPDDQGRYRFDTNPVDFVLRPEPLLRVRRGFGVLIPDDLNDPVFRAGDIILCNPHLPIRKGNEVILMTAPSGDGMFSKVATILDATADAYVLRNGLGEQYTTEKAEWSHGNLVVGKFSRF